MNKSGRFSRKRLNCLDVGPIKGFRVYFETRDYNYVSVDLDSDLAMVKMDATCMAFPNAIFDVIICSHVLEHIKNDAGAIAEMFRVLKSGGTCYIMVPLDKNREDTIEYQEPNPLDPLHVRSYGLDIIDRIKSAGFQVSILNLDDGLCPDEICFVCKIVCAACGKEISAIRQVV